MKLSQIRDMLAVAEHGSLRAAARQLDVAQPAITRSIRELEDELGATLFERHARGVRLTEMGEAFVRRGGTVVAELRRAREEIAQLKGQYRGEVSVALSSAPSVSLLPTALAAFRRRYPDVVLKLSESFFPAVRGDLASGRLDFYVGPVEAPMAQPQFAMDELYVNTRVVLARKGHPLASRRSLADLADAQWVRVSMSAGGNDSAFETMFAMQGLPAPHVALHVRSNLLALLAVANSDLLAIVPQQWPALPVMAGLFARVELDHPLLASPIYLVRRHEMPLTPVAEHFGDLIRRAALNHGREQAEAATIPDR